MRALIFFAAVAIAAAQQPAFELATVKASNTGSTGMGGMVGFRSGGRVSVRNITLKHLIQIAYGVEDYRVTGGPGG